MKKLAGLLIILAVLIFGGYYGMGVITERTLKKDVELVNQSNGLFAELEQYHRGLYSSTAKIQWRVHVPEHTIKDDKGQQQVAPAQDYQMDMPVKIYHGPIIFANNKLKFGMGYAESTVNFPEQYNQQFDSLYTKESVKPKLDISIFVNYLTNSTLNFTVPPFKLISNDGKGEFTWKGIVSQSLLTGNVDKIKGDFVIQGADFTKEDSKLTLDKVTSDYNLHATPAGIYLGNASFSLPSFLVNIKGQKMFEVADFALSSESDIEHDLFSTHFSASLKSLFVDGKDYGPGDVEITLRNLDATILAQINEQANEMQNGNDADRQRAMLAMLPQLPKLFGKGAEFEVSQLKMKLPEGMIKGTMAVSLPKGDTANPFELLQKIHGSAKLSVPTVIVKQLLQQSLSQQLSKQPEMQQALTQQMQKGQPQASNQPAVQTALKSDQVAAMQADKQLAALEQSGLILVKGSDYVVEVNLEQGKITINNKPFDPLTMKF